MLIFKYYPRKYNIATKNLSRESLTTNQLKNLNCTLLELAK